MSDETGLSNLSNWRNPLISRGAGRQILQVPFDDSIDSLYPLECFFQMPSQVRAIRSAQVWVQSKPFRSYDLTPAPFPSATESATHTHNETGAVTGTENQTHTHVVTITMTPGIVETTAFGGPTLSLFVADDGINYGSAIASGIAVGTGFTKQTLLPQLTKASGDKRIKIVLSATQTRLQVLLLLDLRVAVLS